MRCANCGNEDPETLWDEGETIYCSSCTHRPRKTDYEDDIVMLLIGIQVLHLNLKKLIIF